MLRVQITHNIDTFLYWFHIRSDGLSAAGRDWEISQWSTCGSQVNITSNWILLPCNLSLYYESKLLMTLTHDFIRFILEACRQMKDGKRPADMRDVSRRIWVETPSIEYCHLIIWCCAANLNYSQLWHISLRVSCMEVSSDILIKNAAVMPRERSGDQSYDSSLVEFSCLVIDRCVTVLNYSQPWRIALIVSYKASHVRRSEIHRQSDMTAERSLILN